jgi:hypothetical protein
MAEVAITKYESPLDKETFMRRCIQEENEVTEAYIFAHRGSDGEVKKGICLKSI